MMATGLVQTVARSCRPALQSSPNLQRGIYGLVSRPQLSTRPAQATHRRWLSSTQVLQSQPANRFTYNVAASYIAKDRPYDPSKHVFHFNPYNRVQPPKKKSKASRPESGQDAFFVSRLGDTGSVALGVADGVGGWMDSGVDPADFSHSFCDYMAAYAYENKANPSGNADIEPATPAQPMTARELMQKGYEAVCHDPAIEAGGSTAIVGVLDPDEGTLEVANLGDSGFIHLRLNAVHGYSEPQTHAFNTPFQLSVVPPSILRRMAAFGGTQLSDLPRDAEVSRHRLRHGDVLVFASDGVWDNLFNQDILRLVSSVMKRGGAWVSGSAGIGVAPDLRAQTNTEDAAEGEKAVQTLQSRLATEITFAAKAASVNTKLDGPFAKEVKRYYPNETWRGGKVDDICVIAVVVSESKPDAAPVKAKL